MKKEQIVAPEILPLRFKMFVNSGDKGGKL